MKGFENELVIEGRGFYTQSGEFIAWSVDISKGEVQCSGFYPNDFSPGGNNCVRIEGHPGDHLVAYTNQPRDQSRWVKRCWECEEYDDHKYTCLAGQTEADERERLKREL